MLVVRCTFQFYSSKAEGIGGVKLGSPRRRQSVSSTFHQEEEDKKFMSLSKGTKAGPWCCWRPLCSLPALALSLGHTKPMHPAEGSRGITSS